MKPFGFLPVIAVVFAACQDAPTAVQTTVAPRIDAAAVTMTNVSFPVDETLWIPCAGENVTFTGEMHFMLHIVNNRNNYSIAQTANSQGVSGTGWVTGDMYHATGLVGEATPGWSGHGQQTGSFVNGSYVFSGVNNVRYIGQGTGNNFLLHFNTHGTVNANGEVTVEREHLTYECK